LSDGAQLGARLRERDLSAAPATLNLLESTTPADREQAAALLGEVSPAALAGEAPGHIIGVTGPPGAGKSTLLSALLHEWRGGAGKAGDETKDGADGRTQDGTDDETKYGADDEKEDGTDGETEDGADGDTDDGDLTVAMLAVDPSSRRSGGSLLGDRARIEFDPTDRGVFIRSTAAGERLGGLARGTRAAAQALAAAFDVVVVETVGVGQAETEVAEVADTVVVVVQPGSGDVLQFLKSGIMEIPDVLVVTKADLGRAATGARSDLSAALRSLGRRSTQVLAVSSLPPPSGIGELVHAVAAHRASIDLPARRRRARRAGALTDFVVEHGQRGLRELGGRRAAERWLAEQDPTLDEATLVAALEGKMSG
jgi:LAO/AO transport system kinase